MDACKCFGRVCSRGQRCGGEGLQGGDEGDGGERLHPTGQAQSHRGWDVQNPDRGYPHPRIIAETGGRPSFLTWCSLCVYLLYSLDH